MLKLYNSNICNYVCSLEIKLNQQRARLEKMNLQKKELQRLAKLKATEKEKLLAKLVRR